LRRLHKPVECSCLLLAKDQKNLSFMKTREQRRTLSSQITAVLYLVAHPVGYGKLLFE
jgi:hypothetical protein